MWITWKIWRKIIADGAVASESDRVEGKNKRQLHKSRANDNSARSVVTTLFVLNVTDCSMHKSDSLVICTPKNLNIPLLLS